jgi:hypothetical protein
MEEGKHQVVVQQRERVAYEQKGFRMSYASPEQVIGSDLWGLLPPEERSGYIVMEVHQAKHEANNRLPVRYVFRPSARTMWIRVYADRGELQEKDEFDSHLGFAEGARCVANEEVFETRRECAESRRADILDQVRAHRAAADELEDFLKRSEVL